MSVTDRQTRQTDGRQHIANVNLSSRSLKIILKVYHLYPFAPGMFHANMFFAADLESSRE